MIVHDRENIAGVHVEEHDQTDEVAWVNAPLAASTPRNETRPLRASPTTGNSHAALPSARFTAIVPVTPPPLFRSVAAAMACGPLLGVMAPS